MNPDDCSSVFAALSEYLDGELPEDDCKSLEEHIQDCPACVEFVQSLRKSVRLGKQFEGPEEPPSIPPGVKEALKAAYKKASR